MDNRIGMINYLDYNYSNTKGDTKAGTTFNSALIKNASDPNYSSDFVANEAVNFVEDTSTTPSTFKATVSWTPCVVGTVKVDFGGAAPVDGDIAADGTVTVTTAAGGQAGAAVIKGYYYDNESIQGDTTADGGWGHNVPEVELKMNSIPVEARARTLRSYWAFDAQYELQKELTSILS